MNDLIVIVGLGNPGIRYKNTRHNLGFQVVDLLSKDNNIKLRKNKFKAKMGEGFFSDSSRKIILIKPETYMNSSGECVEQIINYFKLPISNLIVVYDDVDLPTGSVRIRPSGGAGTHNGMRSIINHIKSEDFIRIRIGIGKSSVGGVTLVSHVLSGFSIDETKLIKTAQQNAVLACYSIVKDSVDSAMNLFNNCVSTTEDI